MKMMPDLIDPIRRLPANQGGRDWVVGDIHGCFVTLEALLDDVDFDPGRDRLLSVGDLIDRGPECARALEYWSASWFYAIRGNHEQMMLDAAGGDPEAARSWIYNGGAWFYDEPPTTQSELVAAAARLPLAIEVDTTIGKVGIVHGDVPRGQLWGNFVAALERQDFYALEAALWGRDRALGQVRRGVEGIARLYVGHTPQRAGVRVVGNVYCIDTGAVYGPRDGLAHTGLTLMRVDGDTHHMREARYPDDPARVRYW